MIFGSLMSNNPSWSTSYGLNMRFVCCNLHKLSAQRRQKTLLARVLDITIAPAFDSNSWFTTILHV